MFCFAGYLFHCVLLLFLQIRDNTNCICPNKSALGISLEGMMLKLKLQYFGRLMRRVDSLEKTDAGRGWGAGGEGDNRG